MTFVLLLVLVSITVMGFPKTSPNSSFIASAPISIFMGAAMIIVYLVEALVSQISVFGLLNFNYTDAVVGIELWRWVSGMFTHSVGGGLFGSVLFFVFIAPMLERSISRVHFIQYIVFGVFASYVGWVIIAASGVLPYSEIYPLAGGVGMGASIATGLFLRMGNQPVSLLIIDRPFLLKNVIGVYALVWFLLVLGDASQAKIPMVSAASSLVTLCAILPGWFLSKKNPYGVSKVSSKSKSKKKRGKKNSYEPKLKPKSNKLKLDSEVDKILDKISENGFQSLTEQEKKVLDKASKNNGR